MGLRDGPSVPTNPPNGLSQSQMLNWPSTKDPALPYYWTWNHCSSPIPTPTLSSSAQPLPPSWFPPSAPSTPPPHSSLSPGIWITGGSSFHCHKYPASLSPRVPTLETGEPGTCSLLFTSGSGSRQLRRPGPLVRASLLPPALVLLWLCRCSAAQPRPSKGAGRGAEQRLGGPQGPGGARAGLSRRGREGGLEADLRDGALAC